MSQLELQSVVAELRLQNPSLERVLPLLGNEPLAKEFIAFSTRRIAAADGLLEAAASGRSPGPPLRYAFGILTPHHEEIVVAAVREGRLSREDLVDCAFDGPALTRLLGERSVSVPIRFETIEGDLGAVYRGASPKAADHCGFDVPFAIETRHGSFQLRLSNAIELWRAGTLYTKEPETVEWLDDTLDRESVLYDVGANIGIYSLYAAHAKPTVRAVSFEPDPLNFARLNKNIHLNGFSKRVLAYPVALSSQGGVTELNSSAFVEGKAEHVVGRTGGKREFDHRVGLIVVTLDSFLENARFLPPPTHLKIDVDGLDMEVLKGAARSLASKELRHVIVEGFQDAFPEIEGLLAPRGFRHVRSTDHRRFSAQKPYGNHIFTKD
jgi:FkbM family methyltransferase